MGRWIGGESGRKVPLKLGNVATGHLYHTTNLIRHLASTENTIGTILLIMTSKGQQNALDKTKIYFRGSRKPL